MHQFLGLDSSTQSLSAIVIDLDTGETVLDVAANFGEALPAYESPAGFLANPDPLVRQHHQYGTNRESDLTREM